MTKQRLEQYIRLGQELKTLEQQLAQHRVVTDTVTGSSVEAPYVEQHITISGMDVQTLGKLRRRKQKVKTERRDIEAYVEGIDDSYIRTLISLRYVMGLPWAQVASNVPPNTEDSVRMAVDRFFRRK